MLSEERFLNGQLVLIVANDSDFAQSVVARWRKEAHAPAFTIVTSNDHRADGRNTGHYASCHLAIVEIEAFYSHRAMLLRLDAVGVPILCTLPVSSIKDGKRSGRAKDSMSSKVNAEELKSEFPRVVCLPLGQGDSAIESVAVVAIEILRRVDASHRAKQAENAAGSQTAQLALGKYVADSIHGFNNALTAVLGNAELLLLDAAILSPEMQEQVDAIHSNAIRLHEMMQRFSSLEAEINAGRKQDYGAAATVTAQAYLSGT